MPEHHDPTPSERDPIFDEVRMQRPLATPEEPVRAAHRAALESAIDKAGARGGTSWRPRRRLVVSLAASVAIIAGVVVAANMDRDTPSDLVAGENDTAEPSSAQPAGPADDALTSAACDGPLPFDVPVGDGYSGPVSGPAPGADAPSADGQLVAHWVNDSTSIEVRWPADTAERPEGLPAGVDLSPIERVGADMTITLDDADGQSGLTSGYIEPDVAGSEYVFATSRVAAFPTPDDRAQWDQTPDYLWGEDMCAVVQISISDLTTGANVLPAAEDLYNRLIAPGGPLVPERSQQLVEERSEAQELESVTPCQVPDGVDQEPAESTPVDGGGPFRTADNALAAHIDTKVITDEGPFGKPITTHTVPTAGYTAISLPDGTIAYQFPDIVAYFIASPVDGGWSITRYEGPTC